MVWVVKCMVLNTIDVTLVCSVDMKIYDWLGAPYFIIIVARAQHRRPWNNLEYNPFVNWFLLILLCKLLLLLNSCKLSVFVGYDQNYYCPYWKKTIQFFSRMDLVIRGIFYLYGNYWFLRRKLYDWLPCGIWSRETSLGLGEV